MQKILRPLDRPRHHLRIEQDIERINAEMPLGRLSSPINFDRVAHRLESVKGEPDRQEDVPFRLLVDEPEPGTNPRNFMLREMEIFEEREHADIGHQTRNQESFPRASVAPRNEQAGRVIDHDQDEQDQDVLGHEDHVEIATGHQKHGPAHPVRHRINQRGHHQKKDDELSGVEVHRECVFRKGARTRFGASLGCGQP